MPVIHLICLKHALLCKSDADVQQYVAMYYRFSADVLKCSVVHLSLWNDPGALISSTGYAWGAMVSQLCFYVCSLNRGQQMYAFDLCIDGHRRSCAVALVGPCMC